MQAAEQAQSGSESIFQAKIALRREAKARWQALQPEERTAGTLQALSALRLQPWWIKARTVLAYHALPSEPDLSSLWLEEAHDAGERPKRWVFPRIVPQSTRLLELRVMSGEQLREERANNRPVGPFGLTEPDPAQCPEIALEEIDLILVPGVAFSPTGHRLGRGGGFYDTLLANCPSRVITAAVCLEAQLFDEIPMDAHDVGIHYVVSEVTCFNRHGR